MLRFVDWPFVSRKVFAMGFIHYFPLGSKQPFDLTTSTEIQIQLWQELVMLRHMPRSKHIPSPKSSSPWISQAKTYFQDAWRSDWRSAGLLYYYSFLNLAKAFLAIKRTFTTAELASTSLYHGLISDPQVVKEIPDYEITIYPPSHNGCENIFAHFYQALTGKAWPLADPHKIQIRDVLSYCTAISDELERLYGVSENICVVQSLLRVEKNRVWFEMLVPEASVQSVLSSVDSWSLQAVDRSDITREDKRSWLLAFQISAMGLAAHNFLIRSAPCSTEGSRSNAVINQVIRLAAEHFADYAFPTLTSSAAEPAWQFVPKLRLGTATVPWNPVLSDYLMAFVLSTILRYHPQLLHKDDKNAFLAQAWCNQSAIAALRRFLLAFTFPPRRINT